MPERPDNVDLALLRILREDGRISLTQLAGRLHVSRATAYWRLGRLRRDGVVRGFSAIVDPAKLGLEVTAIVLLSTGSEGRFRWRDLRKQLDHIPEVEYAALITGDADVLVLVRTTGQRELRTLLLERLQGLPHVTGTLTLMVLDEVVRRPFALPADTPDRPAPDRPAPDRPAAEP